MSNKKSKIEAVDNQIDKYYLINLYEWRKKHWYSKKMDWKLTYQSYMGYGIMNPDIARGMTVKKYFEKELENCLEKFEMYNIIEIHNTIIQKNNL